ncbi:VOC family protein [Paenibacillus filicis]|uniref:VOC family protein n=1 Tax=Paenibacillus filicis TaxID=669464 RepID=A0ABU9DK75_9BACL
MGLAFDHLIHFVQDPAAAAEELQRSGFHAAVGGRHESLGTSNALVYFGLSYVELLGVYDRSVTERASHIPVMRQILSDLDIGEGPGTLAIRTSDLEATTARLREQGLGVLGPYQGSRERPDGTVVRWSMTLLEPSYGELPLPFFIQWEQHDDDRRLELEREGSLQSHPRGDLELDYIGLAVEDAERTASEWGRWFGLPAGETFEDQELQAWGRTLKLPGGNLVFLSPTGPGRVQDTLSLRGPRPFLIGLKPKAAGDHVSEGAGTGEGEHGSEHGKLSQEQSYLGAVWKLPVA